MDRVRIRNWRQRAEELRVVAETMTDAQVRRHILDAAKSYERLANDMETPVTPIPAAIE